jgi:hypothetical protein
MFDSFVILKSSFFSLYLLQAFFQPIPTFDYQNKQITSVYDEQDMSKRRRRPGRKRKRRPQQQYQPTDEEWQVMVEDESNPYTNNRNTGDTTNKRNRLRSDQTRNSFTKDENTTPAPTNSNHDRQRHYNKSRVNRFEKVREPYADGRERLRPPQVTEAPKDKSYRKPYAIAKKSEEQPQNMNDSSASVLKNILKQSGGLSLSEILQQKNVSLADLLKGKHNVVAVLTESTSALPATTTTEPIAVTEPTDEENELPQAEKIIRISDVETTSSKTVERSSVRRIPNFSRQKTKELKNEAPESSKQTPARRLPSFIPQYKNDELNSVEEPIDLTTYPTIPVAKEEKTRPIKEIISRMRPDLNNSNVRTRFSNQILRRKPAQSTKYAVTEEEKDTTQASHVHTWVAEREKTTDEIPTAVAEATTFYESSKILETTTNFEIELPTTSAAPPTTFSTTPTTTTTTTTTKTTPAPASTARQENTKRNMRNRLATPRQRIRIFTKAPPIDDIELSDGSNVIEDNLPFDYGKPKNIASLEQIFPTSTPLTRRFTEEQLIDRINENTEKSYTKNSYEDVDVTESNPSLFTDLHHNSSLEDKSDILELLGDRRSGARLTKILLQRNMSLDELLDQRERGSSQLHLAEIMNAKSRSLSAPRSEDRWDIVTAFEHFPRFNIGNLKSVKPDDIQTDSRGFSYFASIINIQPTDDGFKEKIVPKEIESASKTNNEYPTWRSVAYNGHINPFESHNFNGQEGPHTAIVSSRALPPQSGEADVEYQSHNNDDDENMAKTVQQIENEVARANDILDLELSGHSFTRNAVRIENSYMSIGVRSAIIASSCIVGVSLFIFIIIFVTCKWRQRQLNKLNYMESFRIAKNRLPTIHKESIKKCVSPELFTTSSAMSKHRLNTMDPNSPEVQDYLWDTGRKQSYH